MTTYEKFRSLPIDHGAIGLEQSDTQVTYYCTPKDAHILGWAGVDGIHYCTIPEFGEMIFAVNPMNFGDCVHPIARDFEDLLRLLLSCWDMAALEQCCAWDREQFQTFLADCPATEKQRAVLGTIQKEFGLEPMEDVFAYVKQLQGEFDLSRIPYTEDYYDPDMNPVAPEPELPWKVTYGGGFGDGPGEAGEEVPIQKSFQWGREKWHIPAVYLCREGLVIDYLKEVEPERVDAFLAKWNPPCQEPGHRTGEERDQMRWEDPLYAGFHGKVKFNGQLLRSKHGYGITWLPESCLSRNGGQDPYGRQVLAHYGLDPDKAWAIQRESYPWGGVNGTTLAALSVRLECRRENLAGPRFRTPAPGESILLTHPLTGNRHTLTVHEVERQEFPETAFPDPTMEYPSHFLAVSYGLEPDLTGQSFLLLDCSQGERPRQKQTSAPGLQPTATRDVAALGILGSADGPTAVVMGSGTPGLHAACSSLHFEPVEQVEWRAVFREKRWEDLEVCLVP